MAGHSRLLQPLPGWVCVEGSGSSGGEGGQEALTVCVCVCQKAYSERELVWVSRGGRQGESCACASGCTREVRQPPSVQRQPPSVNRIPR